VRILRSAPGLFYVRLPVFFVFYVRLPVFLRSAPGLFKLAQVDYGSLPCVHITTTSGRYHGTRELDLTLY